MLHELNLESQFIESNFANNNFAEQIMFPNSLKLLLEIYKQINSKSTY